MTNPSLFGRRRSVRFLVALVVAALGRLLGMRRFLLPTRLVGDFGAGRVPRPLGPGGLDVLVVALGGFLGVYGSSLFAHSLLLSLVPLRPCADPGRRSSPSILAEGYGPVSGVYDGY